MTPEKQHVLLNSENFPSNQIIHLIEKSVTELVERTDTINNCSIYIFGSLGRRIAMSEATNWDEYRHSIIRNPAFAPRFSKNINGWDIDIAFPKNEISWNQLATISNEISKDNFPIEIDPHFINIDQDKKLFKPKGFNTLTPPVDLEFNKFNSGVDSNNVIIKIPNRWTQLLTHLSNEHFQPKSISELILLVNNMINRRDFDNHIKNKQAINIIKNNKGLTDPIQIMRFLYYLAIPYPLIVRFFNLRKTGKASLIRTPNFEKSQPVYL